jgi:aspartyl-tRNA(Asn)/glutamyl-tRNA(Gln) amidotransferase subunit C
MEVTREDVLRCARLADLSLREDEIEPMRRDMAQLLNQAQKLDELDLEAVDATLHGAVALLPRREDSPSAGFSQAEALSNAPAQERGHFLVPKVL